MPATARSLIAFIRIAAESHAPAGSSTSGLRNHVSSTWAVARSQLSKADFPVPNPNPLALDIVDVAMQQIARVGQGPAQRAVVSSPSQGASAGDVVAGPVAA